MRAAGRRSGTSPPPTFTNRLVFLLSHKLLHWLMFVMKNLLNDSD